MKDISCLYCLSSRSYESPQWNIDNALQPRVDLLKQMIKDLEANKQ